MQAKSYTLRSGQQLVVEMGTPPLPDEAAQPVAALIKSVLSEEFIADVLAGRCSEDISFHVGRGCVNGEVVGTCWVGWRHTLPELAVMGGVAAAPAHQRQGVASTLCRALCESYDRSGGGLLYLATTSDVARRIYQRLGFRRVVGQVLCRATGCVQADEGFESGLRVTARPVNWGDLAAVVPLYIWPHECILVDAATDFPSTRIAGPKWCVSIFWRTWVSVQPEGNRWDVLENERGWIVAAAVARRTRGETRRPRPLTCDFIWHPDYSEEGVEFVRDFLHRREAESGASCELLVAEGDDWKLFRARQLGFKAAKRSDRSVKLDDRWVNLIKLSRR